VKAIKEADEVARLKKREEEALKAFQKTIIGGMKVKHKADGAQGTVLGMSGHIMYDLDVLFEDGVNPCYRRNLLPEWWPLP
jgi:hypothetical protein